MFAEATHGYQFVHKLTYGHLHSSIRRHSSAGSLYAPTRQKLNSRELKRQGMAITRTQREQRGIDAPKVRVDVDIGSGLPTLHIVAAEAVVKERKGSRGRAGGPSPTRFQLPSGRITVNLPPRSPKEGGRVDLPMPSGILSAPGQLTDARSELPRM